MPIHFDNMSKGEGADVIGWLRCVEAQGGQSIHAGLFRAYPVNAHTHNM